MQIETRPGAPGASAAGRTAQDPTPAPTNTDPVVLALSAIAPAEDVVRRRAFGALLRALNREMNPR